MWKRLLGEILSPPACAACDAPVPGTHVFCAPCARSVTSCESSDEPLAFAAYGGAIAVAIRRLKYEDRPDLARPLAELLRTLCRRARIEADVVVPVPLHPRRLADRGYNQAMLLGGIVAKEIRARALPRALVRVLDTPRQAELAREARFENVASAFSLRHPCSLEGRRILLVDDVSTTGATLEACRQALRPAKPASIRALVLARTLTD